MPPQLKGEEEPAASSPDTPLQGPPGSVLPSPLLGPTHGTPHQEAGVGGPEPGVLSQEPDGEGLTISTQV